MIATRTILTSAILAGALATPSGALAGAGQSAFPADPHAPRRLAGRHPRH